MTRMQAVGSARGRRRPPSITIVLADDHQLVRDSVKCLLEVQKDFEVIGETGDGLKVASLVGRLKPRVLIVNLGLPGLNGLEVTRRVTPDTRVIVLSRSPSERSVIEALRSGAAGFVAEQAKVDLIRYALARGILPPYAHSSWEKALRKPSAN